MATTTTDGAPAPRFEERQRLLVVLALRTEVGPDGLSVRLSPLPGTGRHVDVAEIEAVETAAYRARDHGGWHWGLRVGADGNAVYRAGGSRGVEVHLTDGRTLFVGSKRPGALRAALAAGLGEADPTDRGRGAE